MGPCGGLPRVPFQGPSACVSAMGRWLSTMTALPHFAGEPQICICEVFAKEGTPPCFLTSGTKFLPTDCFSQMRTTQHTSSPLALSHRDWDGGS